MVVQVTLLYADLISFGHIPKIGMAKTYGRSVFSFPRTLHILLHNDYTNLNSYNSASGYFLFTSLAEFGML